MTPWPETEVVVTGLKGGVGALLARDALLRGAKKVWLHHPSSKKTEIDADDLEVSCGILRDTDVGEGDVASAFARRLRAYGIVEALGHGALDVDAIPPRAVVFACDAGDGHLLSTVAGLGEEARKSGKRFVFARARGLVGTVFVDSGTTGSETLYRALRPKSGGGSEKEKAGGTTSETSETTRRAETLHAAFLSSNPETKWLLEKKPRRGDAAPLAGRLRGAEATGLSPGAFASRVAELAIEAIEASGTRVNETQWTHRDALDLLDPSVADWSDDKSCVFQTRGAGGYEPIPDGSAESTEKPSARTSIEDAESETETVTDIERFRVSAALIGEACQRRLGRARVLLLGAGTPGGGAALVSLLAAGVGRVDIFDDPAAVVEDFDAHPILRVADPGDLACASAAATCARVAAAAFPGARAACLTSEPEARIDGEAFSFSCVVDSRGRRDETDGFASPSAIVATGASAALEVIRRAASIGVGE